MPKNGNLTKDEFTVIHFLKNHGRSKKEIEVTTGRSTDTVRRALLVETFEEYEKENKNVREARIKREASKNDLYAADDITVPDPYDREYRLAVLEVLSYLIEKDELDGSADYKRKTNLKSTIERIFLKEADR